MEPPKPPQTEQKPQAAPEQFTSLQAAPSSSVAKQIEEIMRRLRLLEERYSGLRKKTQFIEQSMLKDAKELFEGINAITETMSELKNQMAELNEKLIKLDDEVGGSVSKSELNTLAKYIEFWQPMDFLPRKEAEKLLKR